MGHVLEEVDEFIQASEGMDHDCSGVAHGCGVLEQRLTQLKQFLKKQRRASQKSKRRSSSGGACSYWWRLLLRWPWRVPATVKLIDQARFA